MDGLVNGKNDDKDVQCLFVYLFPQSLITWTQLLKWQRGPGRASEPGMESQWNAGVSARALNTYALIGDGIIDPAEHTISLEKNESGDFQSCPGTSPLL